MGVAKAALEAVSRYLARDLGPRRHPRRTSSPPGRSRTRRGLGDTRVRPRSPIAWARAAPLGWDTEDPAPVADAVLFLLSDLSRGISGEILHADGGASALAALS